MAKLRAAGAFFVVGAFFFILFDGFAQRPYCIADVFLLMVEARKFLTGWCEIPAAGIFKKLLRFPVVLADFYIFLFDVCTQASS